MNSSPVNGPTQNAPRECSPLRSKDTVRRWSKSRKIASRMLTWAAVPMASCFGPRADGRLGILAYHRTVPEPNGTPPPTYNVSPERFRRQLEGLLARGYRPVKLSEAIRCHQHGKALSSRSFVVTFDDAYESVLLHALAVLESLGVPATLFIATAYLDSSKAMPFDDWEAAGSPDVPPETWRAMTTSQCLSAQDSGLIELGCHTHAHDDYRGRPEDFEKDIRESLRVLEERFGVVNPPMAFPFGVADAAMLEATERMGFACGLTAVTERVDLNDTPHGWGRYLVEPFDTAATLAAKLSGWYDFSRGRGGASRSGDALRTKELA